jgi:hypothetical protein
MLTKSLLFPVTRQDKALSQAYFNKTESPKPKEAIEVKSTKLSADEIQHYVDILLEASKPAESIDHTMQILLRKFPEQD